MPAAFVDNICKHFEKVTDPRVNRGDNYYYSATFPICIAASR